MNKEPPPWKQWVDIFCHGRSTTAFYSMGSWYCRLCGSRIGVVW